MKLKTLLCMLVLVLSAPVALAESNCVEPDAPKVPNQEDMTESELIDLVGEVKAFNTKNEAYRQCISQRADELASVATPEQQELWLIQYNNSVDLEHSLAENLNGKIRAYKAKHK